MSPDSQRTNGLRFLENLAYLVPGSRGYRRRELRREEDSRLRARVNEEMRQALQELEQVHQRWRSHAAAAHLDELDRQRLRLMTLCTAVRQGPYDHWSFFETDELRETTIECILEADLLILQDLAESREHVSVGTAPGAPRRAGPFLQELVAHLDRLEQHLIMRERVLASV
jgi:hypothetical protein